MVPAGLGLRFGVGALVRIGANHDALWQAERLSFVPGPWRERVRRIHAGKLAKADSLPAGRGLITEAVGNANLWLVAAVERMEALRVPVSLSDSELCEIAREKARECMSLGQYGPGLYLVDVSAIRAKMGRFVAGFGIVPPGEKIEDRPAISRMTDSLWWRRRLRVSQGRALEAEAIRLGYVHKNAEIYASDVTVAARQQQRRRNAQALESAIAVNLDTGQEFKLAELAARSVANPTIRRGELMTRIAGFESVAKGLGHVGLFITQTCPSRMHPKRTNGAAVFENPKFDGSTPKEAARYLSATWAKIRAALARRGVAVYGFRIAEPHHDGTPHWHCLVFCALDAVRRVLGVWCRYARREDKRELNSAAAKKARFHVKRIDWARGTAAGYIAKYVSKNIDGGGYQVQGDIEGGAHDAITPSHRVEAWAARWSIRQFQQVGGPPVGVWRELRRSEVQAEASDKFEAARTAADVGNWEAYVQVMGGPVVKRCDLPLRVASTRAGERWDFKNQFEYPAPLNRYGEVAPGAVYGVLDVFKGRAIQSRRYRWEVRGGNAKDRSGGAFGRIECVVRGAGSAGVVGGAGLPANGGAVLWCGEGAARKATAHGAQGEVGAKRPWSPVNNCTRVKTEGLEDEQKNAMGGAGRCQDGLGIGTEAYQSDGRSVHGAGIGFSGVADRTVRAT